MGGGSLFFLIQPRKAVLGDVCEELIESYAALRDNAEAICRYLRPLKPDRKLFYEIRSNRSSGRFKRASEFIYLNKTCWNGLYRVNSLGEFNTPYGRPKSENITDFENLKACSKALRQPGVSILTGDFEETLLGVKPNDFVYFDPPYVTGHRNNGFIDYNETLFSWKDQERLATLAEKLRQLGVFIIVSNADHSEIRKLYPKFRMIRLTRKSTLASDILKRGIVTEALFVPQPV